MKKVEGKKIMSISMVILLFISSFCAGVASKFILKSSWQSKYTVKWSEEIGEKITYVSYGEAESNKFDIYLPKDNTRENYGLVVYLHAGGFTSGDKSDDESMLAWLCSKGYVAVGINYSLRTDTNNASVLSQSYEIKQAIPIVIEEAQKQGYNIDKMAIGGGSAGHALAMIYAYRDSDEAPVDVVLTFGAVGPSSYYVEDWGIFGLGQDNDSSRQAAAGLFTIMSGKEISADEIADGSYLEKVKDISPAEWVSKNPIPTVVAYGACDKMQPFAASKKLEAALKENNVDYQYFVLPHSGHGLQNDDSISRQWIETVEEYLDKYMPIK